MKRRLEDRKKSYLHWLRKNHTYLWTSAYNVYYVCVYIINIVKCGNQQQNHMHDIRNGEAHFVLNKQTWIFLLFFVERNRKKKDRIWSVFIILFSFITFSNKLTYFVFVVNATALSYLYYELWSSVMDLCRTLSIISFLLCSFFDNREYLIRDQITWFADKRKYFVYFLPFFSSLMS